MKKLILGVIWDFDNEYAYFDSNCFCLSLISGSYAPFFCGSVELLLLIPFFNEIRLISVTQC